LRLPASDQAVIATKFGWRIQDGTAVGLDSRPEEIRRVAGARRPDRSQPYPKQ
jgi:aryl-alcohol dehydrogenase-like predicted oxidoreductase